MPSKQRAGCSIAGVSSLLGPASAAIREQGASAAAAVLLGPGCCEGKLGTDEPQHFLDETDKQMMIVEPKDTLAFAVAMFER
jgi:hypothetical protein